MKYPSRQAFLEPSKFLRKGQYDYSFFNLSSPPGQTHT